MARTLKSDKTLFLLTTLLVGASIVMVYSASSVQAANKFQASYYFLAKQGVWSVLGFVLMFGAMQVDYHDYRRPAVIWSLLGMTIAQTPWLAASRLYQAIFYVVAGIGWVLPAMPIISWMSRPDR